ncbi:MAG TPA: molybdopterin-guanine dinucleotide biosynthesis protein B [Paraburkholderia sp.]|uniref:molybdopterin-guanine dinucleotide biosynthesis protein B n=1 Tax=Paraburkholderia sp. TaxID=1926495 RepID=UPI002ED67300
MMRVIGLAGWSGAGKTTLIARLIPELKRRGLGVSTLKHAHHAFDLDQPGKDSYLHREAGATEVLVASRLRWAIMHEQRGGDEPALVDLLPRLSPVDVVLVEGFKTERHAKIEVYRGGNEKPWLYPGDPDIVAVISDAGDSLSLPHAHLDNVSEAADLVLRFALPMDETLARLRAAR